MLAVPCLVRKATNNCSLALVLAASVTFTVATPGEPIVYLLLELRVRLTVSGYSFKASSTGTMETSLDAALKPMVMAPLSAPPLLFCTR